MGGQWPYPSLNNMGKVQRFIFLGHCRHIYAFYAGIVLISWLNKKKLLAISCEEEKYSSNCSLAMLLSYLFFFATTHALKNLNTRLQYKVKFVVEI